MKMRSVILGTKSDEELLGTPLRDIILGKKGDDTLDGGDENDWLFGGKGNDELFGGSGNDKLFGGKGDDYLDGGAGNDYLFGGKGDDTFNFTLSENIGATNYYNGGKGSDTLQLTLTHAEYEAAKAEIDKFEAFIAEGGKVYHFDSWGLTVRDFEAVTVKLVGGGNAAPVANDDFIVGAGSAGGTVRVAVIGGGVNFADEVNAWLNDTGRAFHFQASALPMNSDWSTALSGYDVAVIGDDGFSSEYFGASDMFAALRLFVDSGHGVVSTGWYAGRIGTYGAPGSQINLDSDYVSPAGNFGSQVYVEGATIVVDPTLPTHPITSGVTTYQALGFGHEYAGAKDTSGGTNGNVVVHAYVEGAPLQSAIISATGVGLSGNAHTVFLGSLHMAGHPAYRAGETLTGDPAKLLEQAIAWATGQAATDEDTPRVIDIAALLANDTDAEGDAFTFDSVANFSHKGAALSINANGNIVYDPRGAAQLQALNAGELGDDFFTYTIIDGTGRTDTATVNLKVLGLADPAPAASSFEEIVVAGLEQSLTTTTDAGTLL